MDRTRTFASKTFVVTDADARIRNPDNLTEFVRPAAGEQCPEGAVSPSGYKRIPQGTSVRVDEVKVLPQGASKRVIVFARALSEDGSTVWGWTSARNFQGEFINETLGATPPPKGASKTGAHAAWSKGKFVKQVTLISILDAGYELSCIAGDTLDAYFGLVDAAAAAGVTIKINSGFRSYPEQQALRAHYLKDTRNNTEAAEAGKSKHQNGVAFDIVVAGGTGNPTYDWLCANAPARGFIRTVSREPWHWEYRPVDARTLAAQGKFKLDNVTDERRNT